MGLPKSKAREMSADLRMMMAECELARDTLAAAMNSDDRRMTERASTELVSHLGLLVRYANQIIDAIKGPG